MNHCHRNSLQFFYPCAGFRLWWCPLTHHKIKRSCSVFSLVWSMPVKSATNSKSHLSDHARSASAFGLLELWERSAGEAGILTWFFFECFFQKLCEWLLICLKFCQGLRVRECPLLVYSLETPVQFFFSATCLLPFNFVVATGTAFLCVPIVRATCSIGSHSALDPFYLLSRVQLSFLLEPFLVQLNEKWFPSIPCFALSALPVFCSVSSHRPNFTSHLRRESIFWAQKMTKVRQNEG